MKTQLSNQTAYAALVLSIFALSSQSARAESVTVKMSAVTVSGVGREFGTLTLEDSVQGLSIKANLKDFPVGVHGIHIHNTPSCDPKEKDGKIEAAGAAGSHFDPEETAHHAGPSGSGHKGDLPALNVASDGTSTSTIYSSRLKLADVKNRSIIIHEGGDNYSDSPKPLGGGGARIACGLIGD